MRRTLLVAKLIPDASSAIGKPIIEGNDFYMVYQGLKHKPLPLPTGKIEVYTFYYNGEFLKIGQANAKSKARYQSHHYHTRSGKSTFANRLLVEDNEIYCECIKCHIMDQG